MSHAGRESDSRQRAWRLALHGSVLLYFLFMLAVGLSHHYGFLSSINDLGTFDQIAWNSLHGHLLQTTIDPYNAEVSRLGIHFDPILLLFAPLYALSPSVIWFIAAQAAALALAAYPIHALARRQFASEATALLWALLYLFNPFVIGAGSWDFHPVILAVPLIAAALLAVVDNRPRLLLFSVIFMLLCKEHMGLAVVGFGLLWWFKQRTWKPALLLIAAGTAHLLLVLGVIMPHFSPGNAAAMLTDNLGQVSRYGWLGHSPSEIIDTLLSEPTRVWRQLSAMEVPGYWGLLLAPLLGLPLLGLPLLLPGIADLLANSLAANPMPHSIFSYHSATLVPPLIAAAMFGCQRLADLQQRYAAREIAGLAAVATTIMAYLALPLPLPGSLNVWAPRQMVNLPDSRPASLHALIAEDAVLSAQANIAPHFSQRRFIYPFPQAIEKADAVVLQLQSPTRHILPGQGSTQPYDPGRQNRLDGHLQIERSRYLAIVDCLLQSGQFGVVAWQQPWLLLGKMSGEMSSNTSGTAPPDGLIAYLELLRHKWHVDEASYRQLSAAYMQLHARTGSCYLRGEPAVP